MSLDCIGVSDAVWDWVRDGVELTQEHIDHAASCSSCASVMAEAQACVAALRCVTPYPAAPDCRSAVMSRISSRRARFAPAWSYAFAILIVAVMIAGAFMWPRGEGLPSESAKRLTEVARHASPKIPLPAAEPKPEVRTHELERPRVAHVRSSAPSVRRFEPIRRHAVASADTVAPTAPKPASDNPGPSVAPVTDDSRALAYVVWPTANQPRDSYQYEYTVADPATGEVTKCSVKRQGDTIEIDMESAPARPEAKPAKESKTNEAIRCG